MKSVRFPVFSYLVQFACVCGLIAAAGFIFGGQAPVTSGAQPAFYQTHVTTDKPIYRTDERVYVRGVVLSAEDHSPMAGSSSATFEIKGPKGEMVASGVSSIIDSVIGFSWQIPASQPGGQYTVRIFHPSGDAAERKFDIRAYRAPRLKTQIVFSRDGYGPGDTVTANLHVERAEGGIPTRAKVTVIARVDGDETWRRESTVDSSGNAGATFKLPPTIERGEGVVAMTIQDGGTVETAAKTIPILLQTIDLAIYPEGGDLIAGLANRVYIEGRTPAQKPADMAGIIVNGAGKEVASFRTEHEGRGRFSFVPAKGEKYSIRVSEPSGITKLFPLPDVKESGVTLSSTSDVTAKQHDVVFQVAGTVDGTYGIALSQRGREFSFKAVTLKANQPSEVALTLPRSVDGVIIATVYDYRKTPIAERLIFRQPERNLKVSVSADRDAHVPGDKVILRVATTDDTGKPLGATVGLTVTDSSVLEMIDKREQAPSLPVMVLLEKEVKDLADAHLYLDASNPKAPLATDLLLGTQGWRRFLRTGTLNGIVTDITKALIPGVTVAIKNKATGAMHTARTDERGVYLFPSLLAGNYEVSASLPGFRTTTAPSVEVNTFVRHDLQLDVVQVMAQVEVAVMANFAVARDGAAGGKVEQQQFKDLKVEAAELPKPVDPAPGLLPAAAPPLPARAGEIRARADLARNEAAANVANTREYAHTLRPNWTEGSRVDFTETVYWNAGVKTDPFTGTAAVSFNLSDSVTSFRVLADGFTRDGTLGSAVSHIESVQPLSIEPKLPLQVTSGDVIQLPLVMINGTNRGLSGPEITASGTAGIKFNRLAGNTFKLGPRERTRQFVEVDVREFSGMAELTLDAKAGSYRDTVSRKLDVQPPGFPRETAIGGVLESNGSKSFEFTIPNDIVHGSFSSKVTVYPTPLASMTDALQSLISEPHGCFEQTSSTSYPMVMAQQYFLTHTGVDPAVIEKTRGLLDISYKKLIGFETRTNGYEWFGANPGHEALTAYGLMQFTDMAEVRGIDKEMVNRTRAWLLSRRDAKGGFRLNSKALDSFGQAPADTTNAYIVWALIESGEKDLEKEIASVKASANSTQDSYIVALGANILYAARDQAGARQLMDKLARSQEATGRVKGGITTITQSGGDSLAIETTALSVLAWIRDPVYAANAQKGLKWIVESNKNGRFGSTQATILALRAIIAHDAAHARPKAPGRLILTIDGKTVGAPLAFTANTQGVLVLPEISGELGAGKHTITLRMDDGSSMPFSMSAKYNSMLPESSAQTQIGIQVGLKDSQIQEGGVTEAIVSVANKNDRAIPTPVAIVGIPGGLEVRHDQLKELVKSGRIDAYEVIGREVVLYWRQMKGNEKFDFPLSLIATVPGSYTGPASRAYLYYTDEHKSWAPGLKVSITPR